MDCKIIKSQTLALGKLWHMARLVANLDRGRLASGSCTSRFSSSRQRRDHSCRLDIYHICMINQYTFTG